MKPSISIKLLPVVLALATLVACDKDDSPASVTYYQTQDQMARPAINTVFVDAADKDVFNTTTPSAQGGAFATKFKNKLLALNPGYTTNLLTLDASTFTGVLSTDVLTASTTGVTTFYDGTNVLTGRTLADDVIDVELILIFGGPAGSANAALTSDHVNANDKVFLSAFPYLAEPH
ncbi:MAG: DUF4331 family protein [Chitinophagaceae bacterium]|nr:DUF4331 family protein [Chitinophagaceae bacterium]